MKTISFLREGWGHALHGGTFRPVARRWWWQRWSDRRKGLRRYSVMCHTQHRLTEGDAIRYMAEGGERVATITSVDCCWDPPDMFTLQIVL